MYNNFTLCACFDSCHAFFELKVINKHLPCPPCFLPPCEVGIRGEETDFEEFIPFELFGLSHCKRNHVWMMIPDDTHMVYMRAIQARKNYSRVNGGVTFEICSTL